MIAVGIIGLTLGAMMTLNGHQLRMVRVSRDLNAATLYQQERVEQLRQARWPDLTSASYISGTYVVNRPESKMALHDISETITIAAYPTAAAGSRKLVVRHNAEDGIEVDSTHDGHALGNERLVKVDMVLGWTGADGREKSRTSTTLISNSGVTRSNLPALGPVAGGAWDNFSTPPPTTPAAEETPDEPADETPDETPEKDKGKSEGKGKNGNTGGQSGQG